MNVEALRTVYRGEDLARARENLRRHAWAGDVVERLREAVAATVAGGPDRIEAFISTTTPASAQFTNCPRCLGNEIHGAYHWDPSDPDVLVCTTCGAHYPDPEYPEDVVFRATRAGAGQEVSYHGAFGHPFNGFVLHSSWTGNIRGRKVNHMVEQLRHLAVLYAVTGEDRYGDTAAAILLRFAQVYPNYLVHSGYGEWTDLPPRLASARLTRLPDDEWTVPPNQPDRMLHAGYWMCGRATSGGQEGGFIQAMAVAYDLVRSRLDAEQRRTVEQDLLRESIPLLVADPALNNKSVANATAAGLVGLLLDDPTLVRFGSRVFWHFVHRWFLPDGGTPESPAYAHMALNPLIGFGDALHGRTLPDGTVEDVYGNPAVARIHRNNHDTLLPDLRHPAFADSYRTTTPSLRHADLMVRRYDRPEYRALLREVRRRPATLDDEVYALFHRDPDIDGPTDPGTGGAPADDRVALPDVLLPWLRIGYLRVGTGEESATVLLSASHWGVHHHRDSLNLTYVDRGHHALDDLGYLWDRSDRDATVRTPAHHLVVVDGDEQRSDGRGGEIELFGRSGAVAWIAASSTAYPQATTYRRTCALIDHGAAGRYLVDLFAVSGGHRHDHLVHGPVPTVSLPPDLFTTVPPDADTPGYGITDASGSGPIDRTWRAVFDLDATTRFSVWSASHDEEVWVGDGWGERGHGHTRTEPDRTVPYLVRRRTAAPGGPADGVDSVFVSVFEVHDATPVVQDVAVQHLGDDVVVTITTDGGTDLVALRPTEADRATAPLVVDTAAGRLVTDATLTVLGAGQLHLVDGTRAELAGQQVTLPGPRSSGTVERVVVDRDENALVLRRDDLVAAGLGPLTAPPGSPVTVQVDDGIDRLRFEVLEVRERDDLVELVIGRGAAGSPPPAGQGLRWSIVHHAATTV